MATRADDFATCVIAAAVIRQQDRVLLLQQQAPDDPSLRWLVPRGLVALGKGLTEALKREAHEETGLDVVSVSAACTTTAARSRRSLAASSLSTA